MELHNAEKAPRKASFQSQGNAMTQTTLQRVLVVGGGPVGLTTAALLARQGIASLVIEADKSYCTGSRAICLSRRSLEILDWVGAADAIVSKGLPWTGGRSYFREQEVLQFDMPHDPTQRFAPMTNIQQFYVEQFVHEAAQRNTPDMVQVLWDTRLIKLTHTDDGVTVVLATNGQNRVEYTDWLVACDGGRSTVRDEMALPLKGIQYEGRYVIVDVLQKSTRLKTNPVERLAWFDPPSNPGSTVLMHRQPDDIWRIDYQVRDDEDPAEAVKPENVLPRVKAHLAWMGESEPWEAQWISIYNAKCLSLDSYRHGRVLFAGDAAHLLPIFGVRGLNSGLDDAGNLAWKLAAVITQKAGDALLDTYSTERRAAAQINIEFGSKSTEFMSPPHHGFDLMRAAALRLAASTPMVRSLINPRQSLPVKYPARLGSDSQVGEVAPEAMLTIDGQVKHLSQFFGSDYCLLCFGKVVQINGIRTLHLDQRTDAHGLARERMRVVDNPSKIAGSNVSADTCILVRPDGYIAGRWETPDIAKIKIAWHQSLYLSEASIGILYASA